MNGKPPAGTIAPALSSAGTPAPEPLAAILAEMRAQHSERDTYDLSALADRIEAAASRATAPTAPARNCDRFRTAEEAVNECADPAFLEVWKNGNSEVDRAYQHLVNWLFAPAEGGAE